MASSFLTRTKARLRRVFATQTMAAKSRMTNLTKPGHGDFGISISRTSIAAIAKIEGIYNVVSHGTSSRIILEELADAATNEMKRQVAPISRTGRLRDSFESHMATAARSEVRSSVEYAESIAEGLGVPSPDRLVEWMKEKPEFQNLSGKKRKRVAFAIYYSIKKKHNQNKTGRSDVTALPPVGERRYDYIKETLNHMDDDLGSMAFAFKEALDNL